MEEVKSAPPVVQSVQTSVISFNDSWRRRSESRQLKSCGTHFEVVSLGLISIKVNAIILNIQSHYMSSENYHD